MKSPEPNTSKISSLPIGCEERCPACPHRRLTQEESQIKKQEFLSRTLSKWADQIEPIQSMPPDQRWNYREKVCLKAEWVKDPNGNASSIWDFGVRIALHRSLHKSLDKKYEFVGIKKCPIHSDKIKNILQKLATQIPSPSQFPLHYIVISGSLVTFVLKSKTMPDRAFFKNIDFTSLGITGAYINLNPACGQRVFSSRGWVFIWGQPFASQNRLQYGPASFHQLIPKLSNHALQSSLNFFSIQPGDQILDLYSGIGISLALWESHGAQTLGIELNGESVACAKKNSLNSAILQGRISDRIPQIREWAAKNFHLFANPPRMGFEPGVLKIITRDLAPKKFIYQSCSPGTLARDLIFLTSNQYKVVKIMSYDFFPQTRHVEALCFLERN